MQVVGLAHSQFENRLRKTAFPEIASHALLYRTKPQGLLHLNPAILRETSRETSY
jgi:hypothetical protein